MITVVSNERRIERNRERERVGETDREKYRYGIHNIARKERNNFYAIYIDISSG